MAQRDFPAALPGRSLTLALVFSLRAAALVLLPAPNPSEDGLGPGLQGRAGRGAALKGQMPGSRA